MTKVNNCEESEMKKLILVMSLLMLVIPGIVSATKITEKENKIKREFCVSFLGAVKQNDVKTFNVPNPDISAYDKLVARCKLRVLD